MTVTECARYMHTTPNVSNVTVPVTAAVAAGQQVIIAVNSPAVGSITGWAATDSKGNTYTSRAVAQHSTLINGQVCILTGEASTALTTADTFTVTVTGASPGQWVVLAVTADDLIGLDVASGGYTGTGSSALAAGPTGAASQDQELVFAAFGYTTTTATFTPGSGFTGTSHSNDPSGTPRSLGIEWAYVDAPGTRSADASLSTSQAWAGAIVAMTQDVPTPSGQRLALRRLTSAVWS